MISQIRLIERNQEIPHKGAFCDLVWSDPEEVLIWDLNKAQCICLGGQLGSFPTWCWVALWTKGSPSSSATTLRRTFIARFYYNFVWNRWRASSLRLTIWSWSAGLTSLSMRWVNSDIGQNLEEILRDGSVLLFQGYKYMFDDSLVTVWSAPNYCYRSASFLYRVSSYSVDFQMWQHRFNSAVFRRGQPHTETLWGGSGRKEGDPRETGLNYFRLEFLTLFLLSRWLLTSFEGGGDELNSEGG